jgi:hypothetical protein
MTSFDGKIQDDRRKRDYGLESVRQVTEDGSVTGVRRFARIGGFSMKRRIRVLAVTSAMACLMGTAFAKPTSSAPKPISAISLEMTGVAGDLSKSQTGEPVQTQEKTIVHDLDVLIAALEKQCDKCKDGIKVNNPRNPMKDSMIRKGLGGVGNLTNPDESNKDWAKLSGRERDRILQSMSEGFPPEYRVVLERYYRRLADEKAAPANGAAAKPQATEATTGKP